MESERNPSGVTEAPRAGGRPRPRTPSPFPVKSPSTAASPTAGDAADDWGQILIDRGVDSPSAQRLALQFDEQRIQAAVARFDQAGNLGPGALVQAIHEGWEPDPPRRRLTVESQIAYGEQIDAWLCRQFPDLCDPSPHPAAISAVIQLHSVVGKGRLTRAEHGPLIRRAVATFDARLTTTEGA